MEKYDLPCYLFHRVFFNYSKLDMLFVMQVDKVKDREIRRGSRRVSLTLRKVCAFKLALNVFNYNSSQSNALRRMPLTQHTYVWSSNEKNKKISRENNKGIK